jgi:hypothetical protein
MRNFEPSGIAVARALQLAGALLDHHERVERVLADLRP